jgi:haloacid dehalogenase superfamily, subfamily IA, variant 3 with third motif having DD or ED/haloacid dehalogenase superfamily, subfamily IA, variant 1 with third motif having Dx(3-4)D or Dx(3-4)E
LTLLIFDCDGVLVDSETLHQEVEAELGRTLLGIQRDSLTHGRLFIGKGLANLLISWEAEYGAPLPRGIEEEIARRKHVAFTERLKPVPFIVETLDNLSAFRRCVASGTPEQTLTIVLQATGLYGYFAPNLFSSATVARGKPAPDIFLYAAERMQTAPTECIVIEDTEHGVQAALAAHMKVIGFTGGSRYRHTDGHRLKYAHHVIDDMRSLPNTLLEMSK